jgi:hypothetical protein
MRGLLDVNVLISMRDAGPLHYAKAMTSLEREIPRGPASCPITQNGCVRILSQPAYPGALPVAAVAERLAEATSASSPSMRGFRPISSCMQDRTIWFC